MRKKYNTPHRSRVVKTRLSEDEYADFTARLAPYGISQSEFLRQAIRRTTIRPVIHVSAVNDELLSAVGKLAAEYGRIGGNLNQIARYLNEYGAPYHEAIDYLREMQRRRDMEISLDELSPAQWDKLSVTDDYPCESYVFHSHGYDLRIDNELVAEAFAVLPQQEQSILILHCVMELNDVEIGRLMGMSKSAVQRHRTKTLKELRVKLMAIMPEGG